MGVSQDKRTGNWKAEIWHKGRKVKTKTFSKKLLAEKYFKEQSLDFEKHSLTNFQAKDYTYENCYHFWHENAVSRLSQRTLLKNKQMHLNYIEPFIGKLKISEITIFQLESIVTNLVRKNLSRATINLVIQHFKAVFNYTHRHELILRNPAKNFLQLKLAKKEMDYFSQDEMDQLLSYTNQKYVGEERWKHVLYLTLFLTGGRLGEVLALEWNRLNFERDLIIISQMWDAVNQKIVFTTKGRKDRVVPMNSILKKEFGAMKNNSSGSFIFSDVGDRPIDPSNFRSRNWEKDLKAVGIRKMRIHDCRHTYASLFVMNSGKLYDLKALLGHADMATTEKYAHLSQDHFLNVKDIIKPNIENYAEVISSSSIVFKKSSPSIHPHEKSGLEKASELNRLSEVN